MNIPEKPETFHVDLLDLPKALEPLKAKPNWVTWKWKYVGADKKTGEDKWTKVPHQPDGGVAKTDDQNTWGTYEACVRTVKKTEADGIGFCLPGSGFAAFDVDKCRDPATGDLRPYAQELLRRCGDTYAEVTVSGTGIRIIGSSDEKDETHKKYPVGDGVSVELYRKATRYITVSGSVLPGHDGGLKNIDAQIDQVYAECEAKKKTDDKVGTNKRQKTNKKNDDETSSDGELTEQLIELLNIDDLGAGNQHGKYGSRNATLFGFLTRCIRAKVDDQVACDACVDTKYEGKAIFEHCRNNGGAKYVHRQIERARETVSQSFEMGKGNVPKEKSQHNVKLALTKLNVSLRYDEFNDSVLIDGLKGHVKMTDAAVDKLWLLIDENFGILPPKDLFRPVLGTLARENSFHAVRDYLNSLKWDGTERLDNWRMTYCGAKETDYIKAVGKIALVAAVRRIVKPGCKFDEMPILEGPQGGDKSTLLKTLAVKPEWFTDDLPLNADSKKIIEQLRGKWILEAAEMVGIRKTTDAHLKSMLSRQTDRARLAYGYFREDVDRQFVIWGTINVENNYLYDVTGNRRYWPIKVGKIDIVKFKEDLDQLWAEAVHLEKKDVSIRLDPKLWDKAAAEQAERSVSDPWLDILRDTIGDLDGKILNKDAWNIVGMDGEKRGQDHNKRIGDAMKTLGFERKDNGLRFDGKKGKGYVRGEGAAAEARIYVVRDRTEVAAAHTWKEASEMLQNGPM